MAEIIRPRTAVGHTHQGGGLGRALIRDGAGRVVNAADAIGVRRVLVHAISHPGGSSRF
jgi:hypothetical protein